MRKPILFVDGVKECSRCHIKKPSSEFFKNDSAVSGFTYMCKACLKPLTCNTKPKVSKTDARIAKIQIVKYKFGECFICGYKRCYRALELHHVDPEKKDPKFKTSQGWNLKDHIKEIDKCVLLCGNCHREVHHGFHQEIMAELKEIRDKAEATISNGIIR